MTTLLRTLVQFVWIAASIVAAGSIVGIVLGARSLETILTGAVALALAVAGHRLVARDFRMERWRR